MSATSLRDAAADASRERALQRDVVRRWWFVRMAAAASEFVHHRLDVFLDIDWWHPSPFADSIETTHDGLRLVWRRPADTGKGELFVVTLQRQTSVEMLRGPIRDLAELGGFLEREEPPA